MAEKLTEARITKLRCEPGQKDAMTFDTEQRGLAVRVVAAGSKTYLVQYSQGGRKHRVPLGSTDAISLAAARSAAAGIMGQVAHGANPAIARKAAAEKAKVEALREQMTLSKLVGDWERLHLSGKRPRYQAEAVKALKRAFADWWAKPADKLLRKDVIKVIDGLPASMARATAAYGRACFSWGIKREAVEANPFEALAVKAVTKRERVLTDQELAEVWRAASQTVAPFGPIVCLLLLTGQRRDEVGGMAWSEISDDLKTWTIPPERTKNGKASIVPLAPAATELLHARMTAVRQNRQGLVYPGEGGKPFGNWSKSKAALDKAAGVAEWRLHDLRRTVATGFQKLGVRLEVTEAVLNHVSGSRAGIVGVYQRHDWAEEKVKALAEWAAHVVKLNEVTGEGLRLVA